MCHQNSQKTAGGKKSTEGGFILQINKTDMFYSITSEPKEKDK